MGNNTSVDSAPLLASGANPWTSTPATRFFADSSHIRLDGYEPVDCSAVFFSTLDPKAWNFFEVKIDRLPKNSTVAVGLKSNTETPGAVLPGWEKGSIGFHSDDGNVYTGKGSGVPFGEDFGVGDVIGCGITDQNAIFFTQNGKQLSPLFPAKELGLTNFYPYIGMDHAHTSLSYNFPMLSTTEKDPNFWFQVLGNPLGGLKFSQTQHPEGSNISVLPTDLITMILNEVEKEETELNFPLSRLLEVSKYLYNVLIPSFKFIDVNRLRKQAVGSYMSVDHARSTYGECFTCAYQVDANGKFRAKQTRAPEGQYVVQIGKGDSMYYDGVWVLRKDRSNVVSIYFQPNYEGKGLGAKLILREINLATFVSSYKEDKSLTWEDLEKKLPVPERKRVMTKKCGVPLEIQNPEEDCCFEVVEGLVGEAWNESFDLLGEQVKKEITNRVSRRCMNPPGMTDAEIKVAIAEEIAVCDEWRTAFQSVCVENQ